MNAFVRWAAIALAFARCPALASAAQAERAGSADEGAVVVELRLEGPLESVELDEGGRVTRVHAPLAAGERLTLSAPLSLWSPAREAAELHNRLSIRVLPDAAAGSAAVLAFSEQRPDLWSSGLPPTLTLRARPPLAPLLPEPDVARLALVAAGAIVALALRRRPVVALGGGALLASAVLFLPAARAAAPSVRVLEGDARTGQWVEVRGGLGSVEVEPGRVPWDDVWDAGAPVAWRVEHAAGAPPRWTLAAEGARIYTIEALAPPPRFERARSDGPELARVWVREADGAWRALGPWRPGEALPAASVDGAPPPGWLASGLPQGVGILLAELAEEPGSGAASRESWVRLVGF